MGVRPWHRRPRREVTTAGVAALGLAIIHAACSSRKPAFAVERLPGKPDPTHVQLAGLSVGSLGHSESAVGSRGTRLSSPFRDLNAKHPSLKHGQPTGFHIAAQRLATAEGIVTPAAQQPWTQSEGFRQTFQWVLISNILLFGAQAASWIGPILASTLDKVFVSVFVLELVLRLRAEGPREYFKDKTNWFDFAFVVIYVSDVVLLRLIGLGVVPALGVARVASGLRLTRSSLRLFKLFENVQQYNKTLVRFTSVAFFVALGGELKYLSIQSVCGMLGIFASLLLLQKLTKPEASEAVYKAVEPGKTFLVKWATLFFAPALVKLPLVKEHFEAGVLIRLAVLLVGGFLGTLLSTAGIASLFPADSGEERAPPAAPAAAPAAATKAPAADRRPYKKRLLGAYGVLMASSILAARLRWAPDVAQNAFMLGSALLGFVGGMLSPKRLQGFVHPMFACILTTWLAAALWGGLAGLDRGFLSVLRAYSTWPGAGAVLSFLLGPTVVALGVLLYERRQLLLRELKPMIATSFLTSLISLFFTAFLARALDLPSKLAVASLLRCISSPFAGDLTGLIGASATFTIAMIVVTGFIGVVLGQPIFNALGLRNPRTRGLSMGAAAHGLGTVALAQSDPDAFPYSALGFVLVGTFTSALIQVPPLRSALLQIVLG